MNRNAIRLSVYIFLLSLSLVIAGLSGCGKGPFEQCLANADCPVNQFCYNGKCTIPAPPKPEHVDQEKGTVEKNITPEPTADAGSPDAAQESVPETTPEPHQDNRPPGCKNDGDCKANEQCTC